MFYCQDHPDERITLYLLEQQKFICPECIIDDNSQINIKEDAKEVTEKDLVAHAELLESRLILHRDSIDKKLKEVRKIKALKMSMN